MAQTPKCLAILLCDDVMEDKRTNKKVIIGTFNVIGARKFPYRHPSMTLYFVLTDGRGEMPVRVEMIRDLRADQGGQRIFELSGNAKFENPLVVAELVLTIRDMHLPGPGIYTLRVLVNDAFIGERKIQVKEVKREG
jgi:hypothetical protein